MPQTKTDNKGARLRHKVEHNQSPHENKKQTKKGQKKKNPPTPAHQAQLANMIHPIKIETKCFRHTAVVHSLYITVHSQAMPIIYHFLSGNLAYKQITAALHERTG